MKDEDEIKMTLKEREENLLMSSLNEDYHYLLSLLKSNFFKLIRLTLFPENDNIICNFSSFHNDQSLFFVLFFRLAFSQ